MTQVESPQLLFYIVCVGDLPAAPPLEHQSRLKMLAAGEVIDVAHARDFVRLAEHAQVARQRVRGPLWRCSGQV